jgi:hypothetical protein
MIIPYLGLYNVQDFAQILYLVGGVCIINRNNVFHSFSDPEFKLIFTDAVIFIYLFYIRNVVQHLIVSVENTQRNHENIVHLYV